MKPPGRIPRPAGSLLVLPTLLSFLAAPAFASEAPRVLRAEAPASSFVGYVGDEFVVAFDAAARRGLVVGGAPGRPTVNLPSVQEALDATGAIAFRRQFRGSSREPGSPYPDLSAYYKVQLPPGADLDAALAVFARDPHVDHVEKIGMHTMDAAPNDPLYGGSQWHYFLTWSVHANQAWDIETGDPSVLVGILDTGVKYFHYDLGSIDNPPGPADNSTSGNVWVNPGEIPGNSMDDDNNGYVDDVVGWDFVTRGGGQGVTCIDVDCRTADNDPNDGNGHGTHVAGTVAAITNNGYMCAGVAGGYGNGSSGTIANGCRVIPLRIGYHATYLGSVTGIVRMDWAAEAMDYVADQVERGANVAAVNCSWGSSDSGGLGAAVDNLLAHDVMVFCAAGNSNSTVASYLGGRLDVLAVGATTEYGDKASFSNHGSWVEIAAPGVNVLSTTVHPDDPDPNVMYYGIFSGTSMSSPHCAAVAALLESWNPALSRVDKANLMTGTAQVPPGYPSDLGAGIVDAYAALLAAPGPVAVGEDTMARPRLTLAAHPNPARRGTEFRLGGFPGPDARVEILDLSGRRVRTLTAAGGRTRFAWNATDDAGRRVPTGLYLAVARVGTRASAIKVTVLE